jgi:ribonuclease T2
MEMSGPMLDRTMIRTALAALLAGVLFTQPVLAQRSYDQGRSNAPSRFGDDQRQKRKNVAGEFDYLALVLSWSPTYCASNERRSPDPQCERRDGRRYAFVLHGLWPQYERGYPEFCPVRGRPFVPQPIVDGMLDIMPSPGLVIHEYKKHGTCSGLDPLGYYQLSRHLFDAIRIPERYLNPFESQMVRPDELMDELLQANPALRPDMIAISCGGAGSRLREVRICFTKDGKKPRSCGRNEDQRRLCSASKMFVPPVRSQNTTPQQPGRGMTPAVPPSGGAPLPGPRDPSGRSL